MWDPRDIDDERQRNGGADRNSGSRAAHDAREPDEKSRAPRDVATRGLDLPRGQDRELILVRERTYELNGAESRTRAQLASGAEYGALKWRDPSKGGVLCRPPHRQSIARERA